MSTSKHPSRLGYAWIIAAGILAANALLAGIVATSSAGTSATTATKPYKIGFSAAILTNPVIAAAGDAITAETRKHGGTVIKTDAQFNAGKQASDIDSLIAQDVQAIVIIPVNNSALQPALERARAKGIYVVSRDALPQDPWNVTLAGAHFDAGWATARWFAKKLGKGTKVAIVQGNPSTPQLAARNNGFATGAKTFGLDIVAEQINFKDSADAARSIADAWKARFGSDLKAVFAYNDPSAIGVGSAKGGGFNPLIVGMNGTQDAIAGVKAGAIDGTWDILGPEQGQAMAYIAWRLISGAKCPRQIDVGFTFYTKQNVDSWPSFDNRVAAKLPIALATKGRKSFLLVGKGATQWNKKVAQKKAKAAC